MRDVLKGTYTAGMILVTGFDNDTTEQELIGFYYRFVYGGGTRNVNDGKVQSCQIFTLPPIEEKGNEHKVALVTFESKQLAEFALITSYKKPFRDTEGWYLTAEMAESSYLMERLMTLYFRKVSEKIAAQEKQEKEDEKEEEKLSL